MEYLLVGYGVEIYLYHINEYYRKMNKINDASYLRSANLDKNIVAWLINYLKPYELTVIVKDNMVCIFDKPLLINTQTISYSSLSTNSIEIEYSTHIKFVKIMNSLPMEYEKMNTTDRTRFENACGDKYHHFIICKTKLTDDDIKKMNVTST